MTEATRTGVAMAVALTVWAAPAFAGPIVFAPHRAVYDLSLDPKLAGADVPLISGRMVMEFAGSACAGYTSAVRFVTQSSNARGRTEVTDSRSTTFESTDGFFKFDDQTYSNNRLVERATGAVTRGRDTALVTLTRPADKSFTIGAGVAFPVEQLTTIIQAAIDGKRFLPLDVYDGADGGETVYTTATVIGPPVEDDGAGDGGRIAQSGLADLRSWPTTISYYEKQGAGDMPSFVLSFVLYENGIGRSLKIDQGDVVLVGVLSLLELLPASTCASD